MTELDLPPRRTMPPEVRERVRTRVNAETPPSRRRGPLSVAAAVVVLTAGAVVLGQSTTGGSDGHRVAKPPSAITTVPGTDPRLTVAGPNPRSREDLTHCWAAVQAGHRAGDYAPLEQWEPVFTVTRARPMGTGSLVRITAFREPDGTPGFCEIVEMKGGTGSWSATVSDPTAGPIPLATGGGVDIHGTFLSRSGILGGVATGVERLAFRTQIPHPDTGVPVQYYAVPVVRDGLFLVEVGGLDPGTAIAGGHPDASSSLQVTGYDANDDVVATGEWPYDKAKDPLIGPSVIY